LKGDGDLLAIGKCDFQEHTERETNLRVKVRRAWVENREKLVGDFKNMISGLSLLVG
jgi:hypothetical protein